MRRLLTFVILLSLLVPSSLGFPLRSWASRQAAQVASIGDLVWYDANANGTPGPSAQEPGLPAIVVCLYQDADGDGVLDPDDPLLDCQADRG